MHTGPHPLQPVQRVGLQRRDDGSQGREVFTYSTLLLGHHDKRTVRNWPVLAVAFWLHLFVHVCPHLSNVYPPLNDPRSDVRSELPVL